MKNKLLLVLMVVLAIFTPLPSLLEYRRVADFRNNGVESHLIVSRLTHTHKRKRAQRDTYYYDASIDNINVRLKLTTNGAETLTPGTSYPIILFKEELMRYVKNKETHFKAWIFGYKSESNWILFVLNFSAHSLFISICLEVVWIIGVWNLSRSLLYKSKNP